MIGVGIKKRHERQKTIHIMVERLFYNGDEKKAT